MRDYRRAAISTRGPRSWWGRPVGEQPHPATRRQWAPLPPHHHWAPPPHSSSPHVALRLSSAAPLRVEWGPHSSGRTPQPLGALSAFSPHPPPLHGALAGARPTRKRIAPGRDGEGRRGVTSQETGARKHTPDTCKRGSTILRGVQRKRGLKEVKRGKGCVTQRGSNTQRVIQRRKRGVCVPVASGSAAPTSRDDTEFGGTTRAPRHHNGN